jgi:hypothetical protein
LTDQAAIRLPDRVAPHRLAPRRGCAILEQRLQAKEVFVHAPMSKAVIERAEVLLFAAG